MQSSLIFPVGYPHGCDRAVAPAATARRGARDRAARGRVGGTGRRGLREADDGVGRRPREDRRRGALPALAEQGRASARRHQALRGDAPGRDPGHRDPARRPARAAQRLQRRAELLYCDCLRHLRRPPVEQRPHPGGGPRPDHRKPAGAVARNLPPGARARRDRPGEGAPRRAVDAVRPDASRHADDAQAGFRGPDHDDRRRAVPAADRRLPPVIRFRPPARAYPLTGRIWPALTVSMTCRRNSSAAGSSGLSADQVR